MATVIEKAKKNGSMKFWHYGGNGKCVKFKIHVNVKKNKLKGEKNEIFEYSERQDRRKK